MVYRKMINKFRVDCILMPVRKYYLEFINYIFLVLSNYGFKKQKIETNFKKNTHWYIHIPTGASI